MTWNTTPPFDSLFYDKQFAFVLLKEVFAHEMLEDGLDQLKLEFIEKVFAHRVKDHGRLSLLAGYILKKCDKARAKAKAKAKHTKKSD